MTMHPRRTDVLEPDQNDHSSRLLVDRPWRPPPSPATHALIYIGHPRSYFFFDTLLPVALIFGLLIATLRQMR